MKTAFYRGEPVIAPGNDRAMLRRVGPPYANPGEDKWVVTPPIVRVDRKTRAVVTQGVTYLPERAAP